MDMKTTPLKPRQEIIALKTSSVCRIGRSLIEKGILREADALLHNKAITALLQFLNTCSKIDMKCRTIQDQSWYRFDTSRFSFWQT